MALPHPVRPRTRATLPTALALLVMTAGCLSGGPMDDAGADKGSSGDHPRILYPVDARHSPIDPEVAAALRDLVPAHDPEVVRRFIKVGDSITVSSAFLHCLASSASDLPDDDALQDTLDHFRAGRVEGGTPFDRDSLSAGIGWTAGRALRDSPSPLERELDIADPAFAVVMYGTNDVGFLSAERFLTDLHEIVERLRDRGVVPLLSTIPPRDDSTRANAGVSDYNHGIRAIAQRHALPLVDFHRELAALPDHGLSGDGVHPSTHHTGCTFTERGLSYGSNVRNLITLEQLDRVRRAAIVGEVAPDLDAPRLGGEGTPESPFVLRSFPFVVSASTGASAHASLHRYSGCAASQDESGPEWVYAFELDAPARVRVRVVALGEADVDVHLLGEEPTEEDCLERHDRELSRTLAPGRYHVAVDSFVSGGTPQAGDYVLIVERELR